MIKRDPQLDGVLKELRTRDWADSDARIIMLILEENARIIEALNKLETKEK